jgi:hypothetical protein
MKQTLYFLLLFPFLLANAQTPVDKPQQANDLRFSTAPYYSYKKGLGITAPDSLFQVNIRIRIQSRATYYNTEGIGDSYEGQVRRARLRLDGFVLNPKFLYVLQLSFAPADTGPLHEGDNLNVIRDAVMYYRPNTRWAFAFGQTKLPGNRETVNSSGALELTDRSINNAKFTIDRDFGFQIHQLNEYSDKFSYDFRGAISTGEGRNVTGNADTGLALTAKAEIYPLGAFTKDGSFFEGDLLREKTPKLMFSGAFQQNNHALRASGEYGAMLFQPRTMKAVLLDAMFKYNGWAAMATYMSRTTTKDPVTVDPNALLSPRYVFTGHGMDYELSYVFASKYQLIARYSIQKANDEIAALTPNTHEYTVGVTKYLWEHTFKLQGEVTYDKLDYFAGNSLNNVYVRFQVEIGI